jgi:hypothetical protein
MLRSASKYALLLWPGLVLIQRQCPSRSAWPAALPDYYGKSDFESSQWPFSFNYATHCNSLCRTLCCSLGMLLLLCQTLIFQKWKTTSMFSKMEDDLNFSKMEDDLNFFKNGRRPQFFFKGRRPQLFSNGRQPQHLSKCKMTSIFLLMEDNL